MRRGINIRKKKKIIFNELNKKNLRLLTLLFSVLIICIIIYIFCIKSVFVKINLEKDSMNFYSLNQNVPFSLRKIILFSSATAESSSVNQLLSLNLSNYCDIGIYLNKIENSTISISSLYINNISISSPELGTPYLYKKVVQDLGKCSFDNKNIINERFDFNVITNNDVINYLKHEVYCDGTTPITLGFYNQNIKTNFICNNAEITYNGTLLKEAMIPLVSLNCRISFTINIITNLDEHYICNVNFNIPFEGEKESIYNTGYIIKEIESNQTNKFIRIK